MNHDSTMADLLPAFLQEASELLDEIDSQLALLEIAPHNKNILNVMFRNFHTIKGGAGFLNAFEIAHTDALITLCRLVETLLGQLRHQEVELICNLHALISATTAEVRIMMNNLERQIELQCPPQTLLHSLEIAVQNEQKNASNRP